MELSTIFLIVVLALIGLWMLFGMNKVRHKIFAVILIAIIIFSYISLTIVFKDKSPSITNPIGIFHGFKTYYSWVESVVWNLKTITANAISMDWTNFKPEQRVNQTQE